MMPYRFDGGCPPTVPSALPLRYGRIEACRLGNKAALADGAAGGDGWWRKTNTNGAGERASRRVARLTALLHEFELHLRNNKVERARDRLAADHINPGARPHRCTEARGEYWVGGKCSA
jgi:hypothetical protein